MLPALVKYPASSRSRQFAAKHQVETVMLLRAVEPYLVARAWLLRAAVKGLAAVLRALERARVQARRSAQGIRQLRPSEPKAQSTGVRKIGQGSTSSGEPMLKM